MTFDLLNYRLCEIKSQMRKDHHDVNHVAQGLCHLCRLLRLWTDRPILASESYAPSLINSEMSVSPQRGTSLTSSCQQKRSTTHSKNTDCFWRPPVQNTYPPQRLSRPEYEKSTAVFQACRLVHAPGHLAGTKVRALQAVAASANVAERMAWNADEEPKMAWSFAELGKTWSKKSKALSRAV